MKTTNGFRVKMRKNDISEESSKKAVKLAPIKKNSKESKLFLNSKSKVQDEEEEEVELIFKKQKSTLDYFDDGDEDIDEDEEVDFEDEYDDNEEGDESEQDDDSDEYEDDDSEEDSEDDYDEEYKTR